MLRNCPVCGSDSHSPVWKTEVVSCNGCGMVYKQDVKPVLYRDLEAYARADANPVEAKRRADCFAKYINGKTLEIGCGQGDLLKELQYRGYDVYGVDPSKAAVCECLKHGLEVRQSSVYGLEDEKYEFAILCHVLEHLEDPLSALRTVRSAMTDHGKCYIEVPDASRHSLHANTPLQEFSDEHINHFSATLLTRLMVESGLMPLVHGSKNLVLPNGDLYPVMWVIAEKCEPHFLPRRDDVLPFHMRTYASMSHAKMEIIASHLWKKLGNRGAILWGAGTFSKNLVQYLPDGVFSAVVDRDAGKHGSTVAGVKVTTPPPTSTDPIVIGSLVNLESIEKSIREYGLTNEIITCLP